MPSWWYSAMRSATSPWLPTSGGVPGDHVQPDPEPQLPAGRLGPAAHRVQFLRHRLEYVAAVARLGSYRRAAEALHISQPALSESVRSLERELGADLLERGRHGARVSSAGRELLPLILGVLDSVDRLRLAADAQHRSSRAVRVGTVNPATIALLVPAIREFRDTHSSTQVEVVGGVQADIQRGLLEGSTDLGLVKSALAGPALRPP